MMVGAASVVLFVLLVASVAEAVINPVVVPATLGASVTRKVDANTQIIIEYTVSRLHTYLALKPLAFVNTVQLYSILHVLCTY